MFICPQRFKMEKSLTMCNENLKPQEKKNSFFSASPQIKVYNEAIQ